MTARCPCTIRAMCWTTRSCRSAPASSPASSKPDSRQVPMHETAQEAITSLHDLSAVDLIAGYRAKQFSPSEVLEEVLTHVAAWEPHIKALYLLDTDGARAVAKASSERWQKGEAAGALDGVPVTIKDNIATKGQPVPLGAASVKHVPSPVDAPPAARLREAGLRHAVIGSFELSCPHPQPLGPQQEPRWLQRRCRRGGRRRLWSAASRHRYR